MEEINGELTDLGNDEKHKYKISQSLESDELSESADNESIAMKTQSLHDKLLTMQAINYKKQGYTNIKINLTSYRLGQPEKVGDYIPDLSAVLNDKTTICDIETNESINETVVEKWKAFDRSGYNFHLIIPNNAFNDVKEIARSHGITVDKYWCTKDY